MLYFTHNTHVWFLIELHSPDTAHTLNSALDKHIYATHSSNFPIVLLNLTHMANLHVLHTFTDSLSLKQRDIRWNTWTLYHGLSLLHWGRMIRFWISFNLNVHDWAVTLHWTIYRQSRLHNKKTLVHCPQVIPV